MVPRPFQASIYLRLRYLSTPKIQEKLGKGESQPRVKETKGANSKSRQKSKKNETVPFPLSYPTSPIPYQLPPGLQKPSLEKEKENRGNKLSGSYQGKKEKIKMKPKHKIVLDPHHRLPATPYLITLTQAPNCSFRPLKLDNE